MDDNDNSESINRFVTDIWINRMNESEYLLTKVDIVYLLVDKINTVISIPIQDDDDHVSALCYNGAGG
jgi:hypothetical protein